MSHSTEVRQLTDELRTTPEALDRWIEATTQSSLQASAKLDKLAEAIAAQAEAIAHLASAIAEGETGEDMEPPTYMDGTPIR